MRPDLAPVQPPPRFAHHRRAIVGLAAVFALCASSVSRAQPPTPPPATPAGATPQNSKPPVQAARLDGPINVDGVLDEAAWQNAPVADAFHQRDPLEWAPATQRTEVRILFDDAAVYISARLFDSAPDSVTAMA